MNETLRYYSLWAFLSLCVAGCERSNPSTPGVSHVSEDASRPEDYPREEEILYLAKTNQIIYVVQNEAEMAALKGGGLSLSGGIAKVGIGDEAFKRLDNIHPEELLQMMDKKILNESTDRFGTFNELDLDAASAKFDFDYIQYSSLKTRPDVLVVYKQSLTGTSAVQLRSTIEVDRKLGGLSYGTNSNRSVSDLLADLRDDLDSASNPLSGQPSLRIKLDGNTDPAIILARIRKEYGDKYFGRQINTDEVEILSSKENFSLTILPNGSGQVFGAATNAQIRQALANQNFLAPGDAQIIVAKRGSFDWNEINQSGLYKDTYEIDLATQLNGHDLYPVAMGRQDMAAYYVRRKAYPVKEHAIPEYSELINTAKNKGIPPRVYSEIDALTLDLTDGFKFEGSKGFINQTANHQGYIGQGTWGSVSRVERGGAIFADKVMFKQVDYEISSELAHAIYFGKYDIGPKVHFANTYNSRASYIMDLADGDAWKIKMTHDHIISYGIRQTKLREMGHLALDDKPGNILIKGNEAYLHDFSFVHRPVEGELPTLYSYGTYAPKEAEFVSQSNNVSRPNYKPEQLQSFYFGLNVLHSRFGSKAFDDALLQPQVRTLLDGRSVIDGDLLAKTLAGRHAEAGLTEEAYNELLRMLSNNNTLRPSVDSFVSNFSGKSFVVN